MEIAHCYTGRREQLLWLWLVYLIASNVEFQGYPLRMRILRIFQGCRTVPTLYSMQVHGDFSAPPQPQVLHNVHFYPAYILFMFTLISTESIKYIYCTENDLTKYVAWV
jgi:hypothetical protein